VHAKRGFGQLDIAMAKFVAAPIDNIAAQQITAFADPSPRQLSRFCLLQLHPPGHLSSPLASKNMLAGLFSHQKASYLLCDLGRRWRILQLCLDFFRFLDTLSKRS
jgi:hypothetical protein